jgi:hypothetical protein
LPEEEDPSSPPMLEWGWAAADEEVPPPLIRKPARPLPKPDF